MSDSKRPVGRPPKTETVVAREAVEAHRQGLLSRVVTVIKNRYDASGMGRRMAGWRPRSTSPNTALAGTPIIRERARDSSRNDPAAASGIQKWTTTLVGIGITPRFRRIKSEQRRQQIVDLYNDFVAKADADGVLSLYGMQTLGTRTWFDGGECFIRKRRRFLDEGLPVPLQIQLLESDMVPFLDTDNYAGLPANNIIRSGIELDKRGKRVAYWVYKSHPGDNVASYGSDDLVRVPASEISHIFEPKRPGQLRGVSELVSVLTNLRNMSDYKDAVLERQKLANLFVAFIKRALPTLAPGDMGPGLDPMSNQPLAQGDPAPLVPLQPGLFQELDDGQDVTFSNPPEAGTTYSDYVRTQGLDTAAGAGLPYELHSGDIINVSDRTLRIMMNEFRRLAEQRQWQIIIPMFCQVTIDWFVEAAVLAGKISVEEAGDVRRVEHSPHGWPDIHPTQDIQGRILAKDAGLRSRSSIISASGDDPDQVDAERKADKVREDKLGLTPVAPAPAATPAAPAPAPAPKPQPKQHSPEEITLMAGMLTLLQEDKDE